MKEQDLKQLMQNLDNGLLDGELDSLTTPIAIDADAVLLRARAKLNPEQEKKPMKKRKFVPFVAAAACVLVCTTVVYADEISNFLKSMTGKSTAYSTVVDGEAYYLPAPVDLDGSRKLQSAIFAGNQLDLVIEGISPDDTLPELFIILGGADPVQPGGYSYGPKGAEFGFHNVSPAQDFILQIDGKQFAVKLSDTEPVLEGGEITPAQPSPANIDWVEIGARRIEGGVQIFTGFDDEKITLRTIGEPIRKQTEADFEYLEGGGIRSGTTNAGPHPLKGTTADGKTYQFNYDPEEPGRPLTKFYADAPADQQITLQVPTLVVSYETDRIEKTVPLPQNGQSASPAITFDLGLQSMTLQTVERTSPTTATLIFKLNTGNDMGAVLRNAWVDCEGVQKGELLWKDGSCTMELTIEDGLESLPLAVASPYFEINGNWTLTID